jgi:hypothetical protein
MNKKRCLFVFMIVLALMISLTICSLYKRDEGFVNTKSCLTLSSDQVKQAYEMCNNMIGSDPSHCAAIIEGVSCPIKDFKLNSIVGKVDASSNKIETSSNKVDASSNKVADDSLDRLSNF